MTALILGVSAHHEITVCRGTADLADIFDRETLCIECGGSGLVHLNNFDHHGSRKLPPACIQALTHIGTTSPHLINMALYVSMIDTATPLPRPPVFPSLSSVFSGMRLTEASYFDQFLKGIALLRQVTDQGIDPFRPLPILTDWQPYIKAKKCNQELVHQQTKTARFFRTVTGKKLGVLKLTGIGGIGALFSRGCDIALLYHPGFGEHHIPKYTIAAKKLNIYSLVNCFEAYEPGWGGHSCIIGSPREKSTCLQTSQIIQIISQNI